MTVLMVLAIFAAFLGVDLGVQLLRRRREVRATGLSPGADVDSLGVVSPTRAGIHRRHMWARAVDPVTVAVGLDDLAARLVGRATGLVMPTPGARVREGARAFRVRSNARVADLVSPVDGTVVEVNAALDDDPGLCVAAPYERGWLCKVRVPDAASSLERLRTGRAASRWMRDERVRLMDGLAACAGDRLAADGGEPVHDLGVHLDRETWELLTDEFLVPRSQRGSREDER